jgi:hypothetical protein
LAFSPLVARDGNNAAQSIGAFQDASSVNYSCVSLDSNRAVYRTGAIFTPFATAPLTFISIVGSATKTVRITRIGLWMAATANASIALQLTKGTALGTGGTAVTPTIQKMDSNSASATAVVKHYTTAAQTLATGSISAPYGMMNLPGSLIAETVQILVPPAYSFFLNEGGALGNSMVLRGTSEIAEVQIGHNVTTPLGQSGGANGPPAMQMGYFIEFIEDAS